jgi:hypothetical protein
MGAAAPSPPQIQIVPVDLNDSEGKDLLIKELETKPKSDVRDEIIHNAQRGRYSDSCDFYDLPSHTLAEHLKQAGFLDMAKKAIHGAYDHWK